MSACTQCDASVIWKQVDGKWQCFNADGVTVHWDSCSQRRFDRIRRTGTFFKRSLKPGGRVEGYKTNLKPSGQQLTLTAAPVIKGSRAKRSGNCQQCVPPWEVCAGCPDSVSLQPSKGSP